MHDPNRPSSEVMIALHQALQSARGSTVFESGGRATVFLNAVASGVVALAFVGQATALSGSFFLISYVVLAVLIFLGLATFVRAVQSGIEDALWARGIGRILHFYVESEPAIAPYLVQPAGDDDASVYAIYGGGSAQFLFTTASAIAVVTGALIGFFAAMIVVELAAASQFAALGVGSALGIGAAAIMVTYERRRWRAADRRVGSRFPASAATPTSTSAP